MLNGHSTRFESLVSQAKLAFETGDNLKAIELLQKAAEGYLIRREYGKAHEILDKLILPLTEHGLNEKVFLIIRRVIKDFEQGEAFEEGGDLLQHVADTAQQNDEYRVAADFYNTAGEFWIKAGGQDNSQTAAICFARAAESYGRDKKSNKAERLFVRAVMSALNIEQELLEVAEKGWRALSKDRCKTASEHFRSVSKAFRRGVPELEKLLTPDELSTLSANATARLYHLSATFAFLSTLCFLKNNEISLFEEEYELVREAAINAINTTIPILKDGSSDSEDIWRTCVDLLLLVISDYFAGVPWENSDLITEIRQFDNENETILLATESISNGQIERGLEYIEIAELGMLDTAKPYITEGLQSKRNIS